MNMVSPNDIKTWIEQGLENAKANVTGDGHHFDALVICPAFEGKMKLEQLKTAEK